jgi:hypothetical protein
VRDVGRSPRDGAGAILHERGIAHLRIDAVVGNDDHEAARAQCLRHEEVVLAPAFLPGAAVEEDHDGQWHGPRREVARNVDVELAALTLSIGDAGVADEAVLRD